MLRFTKGTISRQKVISEEVIEVIFSANGIGFSLVGKKRSNAFRFKTLKYIDCQLVRQLL